MPNEATTSGGPLARPPRARLAGLLGVAAVLLLTVGTLAQLATPAPKPADAPAGEFSAGRAFQHVTRLGAAVHPIGSAAAARNRDYLLATLRADGVSASVQEAVGDHATASGGAELADVHNVVARIPGRHSTGTVFLVAHTDSVRVGPGGSDDGAGAATLLETARALAHGPKPRNDVVFVFTDGEEACLCGAAAFVDHDPLARGAASHSVVLNVEARGSGGPVIMFETSAGNADLVGVFGAHAPHPLGTSFAVEIYRRLPNDTDFTMFREAGFAGLNSAYLDGSAVYHTPQDTPAAMDRGSLQEHGDNALAMARAFDAADLHATRSGGDATYFPVLGLLVRYPGALTWPLAGLALLLVLIAMLLARRAGRLTLPRLVASLGLTLLPIVVSAVLAQGLWALLVALRPGYAGLMTGDPWHPGAYRLAVAALTLAVLAGAYVAFRRRFGATALALAGLGWLAVIGLVLAGTMPGGSYLATLPALFGAVGALVALRAERWAGWALAIGALPTVLVLAPTVALLFPALGLATGAAGALLVALAGLVLLPLLELSLGERRPTRFVLRAAVPAGLVVVAVVCGAVGFAVDGFTARHPAPAHLTYALDADTGRAIWASSQPTGDRGPAQRWLAHYVGATQSTVDDRFPVLGNRSDGRMRTGTARRADLAAPTLTVESAGTPDADGYRTVRLRLTSKRGAPIAGLYLPRGTQVRAATVAGEPVVPRRTGRWALAVTFFAVPAAGLPIELRLRGAARARILDESDGLTRLPGFVARPAGVGVAPAHDADEAVVARTVPIPAR